MKKKTVKEVKLHKSLVCAYKYQDFVPLGDRVHTNTHCEWSGLGVIAVKYYFDKMTSNGLNPVLNVVPTKILDDFIYFWSVVKLHSSEYWNMERKEYFAFVFLKLQSLFHNISQSSGGYTKLNIPTYSFDIEVVSG